MTKPRIRRPVRVPDIKEVRWLAWRLGDLKVPEDAAKEELANYWWTDEAVLSAAWREHGPRILSQWIEMRPGTRPSCWWLFDAPREPAVRYPKFTAAQRLRVGGRGTAAHDVMNYKPYFYLGMPKAWACDSDIDRERDFPSDLDGAEHFDASDPPRFESQAAYLQRHALLGEAEGAALSARDFAPEVLPQRFWPTQENQ